MQSLLILPYSQLVPVQLVLPQDSLIEDVAKMVFVNHPDLSADFTSFSINGKKLNFSTKISEIPANEVILQNKKDFTEIDSFLQQKDKLTYEDDIFGNSSINGESFITMHCGHIVSKKGLFDYLLYFLAETKTFSLYCPEATCLKTWDYQTCQQICLLSKSEKNRLEERFSMNFIDLNIRMKECPSCCLYLEKKDIFQKKTKCTNCHYIFCWCCFKKWNVTEQNNSCGDMDCGMDLALLKLFLKAKKKIGKVAGVPQMRCCPKCSELIEHSDACKHVSCKKCLNSFCFVCLKSQLNGVWQCGNYADPCEIAPRQPISHHWKI